MVRKIFPLLMLAGIIAAVGLLSSDSGKSAGPARGASTGSATATGSAGVAVASPARPKPDLPAAKCRSAVRNIDVAGQKRTYRLRVPPAIQASAPLVIALHGYKGTAEGLESYSGLSIVADREGFLVAYPQALGETAAWNIGLGVNPDVTFLDAVMDEILADCAHDPSRVYVVGHSRGGGMAHRMACEDAQRVAAIAAVAGAFFRHLDCSPARPTPVLAIHGLGDPVVPYEGRPDSPANLHATPRLRDWAAAWAARNGCAPTPEAALSVGGEWRETWSGCQDGVEVMLRVLDKAGHEWPVAPVNAAEAVWRFFEQH